MLLDSSSQTSHWDDMGFEPPQSPSASSQTRSPRLPEHGKRGLRISRKAGQARQLLLEFFRYFSSATAMEGASGVPAWMFTFMPRSVTAL